jgi:hypothetical protein
MAMIAFFVPPEKHPPTSRIRGLPWTGSTRLREGRGWQTCRKSLKVRHKVYIDSYTTELILFIEINRPGQELAKNGLFYCGLRISECGMERIIHREAGLRER